MSDKKHPFYQFKFCPKCGSNLFVENNFKSKRCDECGFIYYFNPSSATVAVIVNENHEILVAKRAQDPAKGTYDLPGGFVDMDETAEQAVVREVNEETGLEVVSTRYLFSIPNQYMYLGFEVETTDLCFLCEVKDSNGFKPHDDVSELQFVPIRELNPALFGLKSIKKAVENIQKMNL